MPNEYDEYDEEETSSNAMKELRSLVKKLQNENKELSSALETYNLKEREQTIAQILTSKGVSAEVAEFVPADVQDEEALTSWLETKGKVFGYNSEATETQTENKPAAPSNGIADLQSIAATPDIITDTTARIASAKTKEELAEALKAAHQTIIR
jgi:hypothetical protein